MSKHTKNCRVGNRGGFTLTEVLVGVTVLAMAVVASSNILVSMIHSNKVNTNTLKAHLYAVEGVEAFRNMRDTHFMHNVDYRGDGVNLWGQDDGFADDREYGVERKAAQLLGGGGSYDQATINTVSPWKLYSGSYVIFGNVSFDRGCSVAGVGFAEEVLSEEVIDSVVGIEDKVIEVTCTVSWDEGGDMRQVSLSEILTDWKSE